MELTWDKVVGLVFTAGGWEEQAQRCMKWFICRMHILFFMEDN